MITTSFCFCHRFQERFSYDSTVHTKCAYKEQLYYQPHHISRPEKLNWFWLPFYIFLYFFQPHYYTQPHTVSCIQSATITCTSLLLWYSPQSFSMDGWVVEGIFSLFFAKKCSSHSLTVELCSPTAKTCNIFFLSIFSFLLSLNKMNFPHVLHFPEKERERVCLCVSVLLYIEPWNFAPVKYNILRFKLCWAKQ